MNWKHTLGLCALLLVGMGSAFWLGIQGGRAVAATEVRPTVDKVAGQVLAKYTVNSLYVAEFVPVSDKDVRCVVTNHALFCWPVMPQQVEDAQ